MVLRWNFKTEMVQERVVLGWRFWLKSLISNIYLFIVTALCPLSLFLQPLMRVFFRSSSSESISDYVCSWVRVCCKKEERAQHTVSWQWLIIPSWIGNIFSRRRPIICPGRLFGTILSFMRLSVSVVFSQSADKMNKLIHTKCATLALMKHLLTQCDAHNNICLSSRQNG